MSAAGFARIHKGDEVANSRRVKTGSGKWVGREDVDQVFEAVHGRKMTDPEWDDCVDAAIALHGDNANEDLRSRSIPEDKPLGPTIRVRGVEQPVSMVIPLAENWILKGYGTSDAEVARHLGTHQIDLRYCPSLGWFRWDGQVWRPASSDAARAEVREVMGYYISSAIAAAKYRHGSCPKDGPCSPICNQATAFAKAIRKYESARSLGSVMTELRTRPEVLVDDPALFDAHPHLLNTPNGVVDLRDGMLGPSKPEYLLTRIAGADYVPGAKHPDWTQALDALSNLNADTQEWLQRYLGSGASGHTLTDSLNVFLHGNGNNGKSTVLGAIDTALGDYAGTVPDAAISSGSSYEQKVAMLSFRGLRFALLEETTEDMRLATTAIKKLSSGNSVSARVLGQGNIEFPASHTLAIATNHTPYVRESDKGTWRRLVLVPFTRDYTKGGDSDIRERLIEGDEDRAEAVLAWLVEGCVAWYKSSRSLTPLPAELQNATNEWRADTDLVGDFLSSQITITGAASDRCNKGDFYQQFIWWCELTGNGNPYTAQRGFNMAVKNHEYGAGLLTEQRGTGGIKQWGGIRSLGHSLVTA